MENRANYLWIGIFVFGVFFASLFVLVFMSGFSHKEEFKFYEIYTKESISGLGIKAPVRLLGVEVGSVEDTSIDSQEGIGVKILIKVKANTPIYQSTYATLQLQGITGLKYIELKNDEGDSTPILTQNDKPATIRTKPSLLSNIDKQSDKIFDLLDFTNERARELFNNQNLDNYALILENSALATEELRQNLNLLLTNFNKAAKDVSVMSEAVRQASNKFYTTLQGYDEVKVNLDSSLELLNSLLIHLNTLSRNLQNSPSDLFFKSTKNKNAPGE